MKAEIDIRKAAKALTVEVEVTGVTDFVFRVWLATQFFKLGARIIGAQFSFKVGTNAEPQE